ncbi:MAG: hypothetical protein U0V56_02685 [Actinomycetota bacterium]
MPKLSMLLSQVNLVIGGVLGAAPGLMLAGVIDISDGMQGAHPAMMVVELPDPRYSAAIDERLIGGRAPMG